MATAMAVFAALFIASASGVTACTTAAGVLPGSPSCFESGDGNMVVDATGDNDWASVTSKPAYFHKVDVASSQSDDSFVSGQKQDTVCPDTTLHGNPPKDDFTDVASYNETASNGDVYLYGATIRFTANGSASENVELKQSSTLCPGQPAGGVTVRSDGDKLLAIDYTTGGTSVDFHVLTWISDNSTQGPCFVSNDTAPCWGATVTTLTANGANGLTNQSPITAANNSISGVDLVANQFAEFGVNLRLAGIIPAGVCKAFPQTVWESRSSGSSFVSTTKDISLENHVISNCGEIKIIKQTNPRGFDAVFPFTSNLPANSAAGGVTCPGNTSAGVQSGGSFCLNDAGNTGKTQGSTDPAQNSTGNTVDESSLQQGTYTVTEGTEPATFGFHDVTCYGGEFGTGTTFTTKAVTIHLAPNDVVVCVYTNNLLIGALEILKKSAKTGNNVLKPGAQFCYSTSQNCSTTNVTDNGAGDEDGTIGSVCVSGVTVGTYYINETAPPTGYAGPPASESNQQVVVAAGTNCSGNPPASTATATFHDPPLADIQVQFRDGGSGETKLDAPLSCDNGTNGTSSNPTVTGWDNTLLVSGVQITSSATLPNLTITCTIKIDP